MNLDPNKYKHAVETIKRIYERDKHKPVSLLVSELSVATSVPALAIAKWLQHLYGTTPELDEQISSLTIFYKYTKIDDII